MGNLFGGRSASSSAPSAGPLSSSDSAILALKRSRDKLSMNRQRLRRLCDDDTERARQILGSAIDMDAAAARRERERARLIIRRRKYHLLQCERIDGAIANIDSVVSNIEFSAINERIVAAMKSGQRALDDINRALSVDDVDHLMADITDAVSQSEAIDVRLSSALVESGQSADEVQQEIEREIAEMELSREVAALPAPPATPVKPTEYEDVRRKDVRQVVLAE